MNFGKEAAAGCEEAEKCFQGRAEIKFTLNAYTNFCVVSGNGVRPLSCDINRVPRENRGQSIEIVTLSA